jgi:hypothetical protein
LRFAVSGKNDWQYYNEKFLEVPKFICSKAKPAKLNLHGQFFTTPENENLLQGQRPRRPCRGLSQ